MQEWQEKIEQEVGQLREEVKQLKEQRTEEIKTVRVDVASEDVIRRLDALKQELTQELKTVSETWLETMEGNYGEHKADFLTLRESQADFRDRLNATTTKEDLNQLETRIDGKIAPMATKNDIARLEGAITSINATQEQILTLLQQKPGE